MAHFTGLYPEIKPHKFTALRTSSNLFEEAPQQGKVTSTIKKNP
jgi:hypothetical protein